jgi:hypothetical protein
MSLTYRGRVSATHLMATVMLFEGDHAAVNSSGGGGGRIGGGGSDNGINCERHVCLYIRPVLADLRHGASDGGRGRQKVAPAL